MAEMMKDEMPAGAEDAAGSKTVVEQMFTPEGKAKLEPLKAVADEMGFSMSPSELLIVAQKDERTAGKSPQELADMLRTDETLYDDLEALASGKLEQMKADMGVKQPAMPPVPPPMPGMPEGGM